MQNSITPPSRAGAPSTKSGVLDRAVAVLDAVEAGARTYTDIVRVTGFTRPTAHRILKSLEEHGFVVFLGGRGYALGPRFLRFATTAMRELPLRDLGHPILERLAASTGEGAQLYVRSGARRLCIDSVESSSELRTIVGIGAELPLTAGSAGKVFLAWMSEPTLDAVLGKWERLTDDTPKPDEIREALSLVRRRGWAYSAGEREQGVASVSAPVFGPYGDVIAVVSMSGPRSRILLGHAKLHALPVVLAAKDIEQELGLEPDAHESRLDS